MEQYKKLSTFFYFILGFIPIIFIILIYLLDSLTYATLDNLFTFNSLLYTLIFVIALILFLHDEQKRETKQIQEINKDKKIIYSIIHVITTSLFYATMIILGLKLELPVITLEWYIFPFLQLLFILFGTKLIEIRKTKLFLIHLLSAFLFNSALVLNSLIWTAYLDEHASILLIIDNLLYVLGYEISLVIMVVLKLKSAFSNTLDDS